MFDQKARLPVDIDTEAVYDPDERLRQYADKLEPDMDEITFKRKEMEANVKANIELHIAQNKHKEYYDWNLVQHLASVLEVWSSWKTSRGSRDKEEN